MSRRVPFAVAVLFASLGSSVRADDITPVRVTFDISVDDYDPVLGGKGTMKCVIRNRTDKPVELKLEIYAHGSGHMHSHHLWQSKDKPKSITIPAGKEVVVFEETLDSMLYSGPEKKGAEKLIHGWTWDARPAPPGPIRTRRGEKAFVTEATFWASARIGDRSYDSGKIPVTIKPSEPPKKD